MSRRFFKIKFRTLAFKPALLPEWVKPKDEVFQTQSPGLSSLKKMEENFRQTVKEAERTQNNRDKSVSHHLQG